MKSYAELALSEYNSGTLTTRRCGSNGKPFWNTYSSQFMFVPQLMFTKIPGVKRYEYKATDSAGNTYSFEADNHEAPLTPIWSKLAVGFVTVRVTAHHASTGESYAAGERTFYKTAPFPGREALPPRARSYREAAGLAFRYVFESPVVRYLAEHGVPDPEYYHNVYPSKTLSSLVRAMISYAELEPTKKDEALRIATSAAQYLLSITYGEESKLAGLPPTYSFLGLNKEIVDANAPAAYGRRNTVMMIYPSFVGNAYLDLERATGDERYFQAASRIAEYYLENVLPSGSWYLLVDAMTGEPLHQNCCLHFRILNFLNRYAARTGDVRYRELEKNYFAYIRQNCLEKYNWEGQFEDVPVTVNYQNLTHLTADSMISYIAENMADDAEMMAEAEELMRFVEDQFVVWGEHAPWNPSMEKGAYWYSPAALEQYGWYVPIDASTITVMRTFLNLYAVNKNPLLLEKACALADSITRMQDPESGVIPTHWMSADCTKTLHNFWFNCHIGTAFGLMDIARVMGEE